MSRIVYIEMKRFFTPFLLIIVLYLIISLSLRSNTELSIRLENYTIKLLTFGVSLWITFTYAIDELSKMKLLLIKATINFKKIILIRLITICCYSVVSLALGMTLFNLKVMIYENNHPLEFFRMNLDRVDLLLIDKSPKEMFLPINMLLNILFDAVVVFGIIAYYQFLTKTDKYSKWEAFAYSVILFSLACFLVSLFVKLFDISKLNFNYLKSGVEAFVLNVSEINFLNVISVVFYPIFSLGIINISKDYKENSI